MKQNKGKNFNSPKINFHIDNNSRLIVGRNSVFELLKHSPSKIIKIYYEEKNGDAKNDEILNLAKKSQIALEAVSKDDLKNISNVENHQGFVTVVKDADDHSLKKYFQDLKKSEKEKVCIVAIDSVEDPHNLGTIFRASECFGVDAVLLSKNRGVLITPVVSKASVGATELVRRIEVSNLLSAIRELKKEGFWIVVADVGDNAISLNKFEAPLKTVLIMGAEGKGVKKALKDEADFIIKIPQVGKIDSLNVSQATAVILYHIFTPLTK